MNIVDDIKWRIDAVTSPLRHAFQRAEQLYWDTKIFSKENNYPEKEGLKKTFSKNLPLLYGKSPIFEVLKTPDNYDLSIVAVRESIRRDLENKI